MKTPVRVFFFLAACALMACGGEAAPAAPDATPAEVSQGSDAPVSAQACTTLRRPRTSSYWESFPIQPDGQVGGCETADDCTVTCWGEQTRNVIHSALFECTSCR